MAELFFAAEQGRNIPKEDKIFGISNRAKARIAKDGRDKVINATIGALLDDEGKLMVLSSVTDVFRQLEPTDFAEYAPIAGTAEFREVIKKDAFGSYVPKRFSQAVATPGGTGAIRNTISNFSTAGDSILVADWFWAPYNTIAGEIGRKLETFEFFDENMKFNIKSFSNKIAELLNRQDRLVIILNTPAHNPTGYALTDDDWKQIKDVLEATNPEKKITLLADVAYLDFAGDEETYRSFLGIADEMPKNVLVVIAHSLSKAYTLYGMRCGAMICLAQNEAIAWEFKNVCEFSSRASWSNCTKAPQVILTKIYADPNLKKKVDEERAEVRNMLIRRGKAFEEAAEKVNLKILPFDAGFFASVPCAKPDEVSAELEKEGIFLVPLAKGVRVSVASISEDRCRYLPERIKMAIEKTETHKGSNK